MHISEADRLGGGTSSIASSSSLSNLHRRHPEHVQEKDWRATKAREAAARYQEREAYSRSIIEANDRKAEMTDAARCRARANFVKRAGSQQLLQISRGLENGKAPIALEPGPHKDWVPVPPHLSSHWSTIQGIMSDPPDRVTHDFAKQQGRRAFPERENPALLGNPKPGTIVWGGAH